MKYIIKAVSAVLAVCMLLSFGAAFASGEASEEDAYAYTEKLFDTSYVHTIDITIADEDRQAMQESAMEKPKFTVTVTIDGESFDDVVISTKGNASLIYTYGFSQYNARFSYKLRFNKADESRTYYGLNEFALNSNALDPSNMRDYTAYNLFSQIGVPTPCVSYVQLYINGELQGLYLAVESEKSSFLERTLGDGEFYKPSPVVMDALYEGLEELVTENGISDEHVSVAVPEIDISGSILGADLKYTDDDPESYSDIFNNAETEYTEEDQQRLIAALKALSEGDVESAVDTDEVIRYFAALNFITSWDSYNWDVFHNYGLYEEDGILSMVPWDYDLAFTGMAAATMEGLDDPVADVIAMDIDNPVFLGADAEDRPMWNWIPADETYLNAYHEVLSEELLPYVESGAFEQELERVYTMIHPYVEQDPTYPYTMEEFETAYAELVDFCLQRTASVRGQLSE